MKHDSKEPALREELSGLAVQAERRGLVAGAGGNVSVRVPGRDEVLVTATGLALEVTAPENLVKVDLFAGPLEQTSPYRPSKEALFHCAVYRARPDVNAIFHLHPPYATAFAVANRELPLVTISATVWLGVVPCIPLALSGSTELRDRVEEVFLRYPGIKAALMQSHGIIAVGTDLMDAYNVADFVEETAKTAYLAATMGVSLEDAERVAWGPVPRTKE